MAEQTDKANSKGKEAICQMSAGPGPTLLLPPLVGYIGHDMTKPMMPAYSLGLKLKGLKGSGSSPGPAYMIPFGLTARGPNCVPHYSISSRNEIKSKESANPGPAAYYPDININRSKPPAYSIYGRPNLYGKPSGPGPIYMLPTSLGKGAVSIKGPHPSIKALDGTPGPIYDVGRPDLTRPRGPDVTIKGRHPDLKSMTNNAGPYDIAKCKIWRNPPAFSLGIRHSPCVGILMTTCDKEEPDC